MRFSLAVALVVLSGCTLARPLAPPGFLTDVPVVSRFLAAGPSGPVGKEGQYAESLTPKESPGTGSYILYTLVGAPRDIIAAVLEPAGYTVGAVTGLALNVVVVPFVVVYNGEYTLSRPVSRICVMVPSFPFFIVSDGLCRSFTGDMNRYRWGIHAFPRADHRFFPNYNAIFGSEETP